MILKVPLIGLALLIQTSLHQTTYSDNDLYQSPYLEAPSTCPCKANYPKGNTYSGCQSCSSGCFKSATSVNTTKDFSCYQCPTGCDECKRGGSCSTCSQNYYLNDFGLCSKCLETNCAQCSITGSCSQCSPGYFVNTSATVTCNDCLKNCDVCNATDTCTTCSDGYKYNEQSSTCDKIPYWQKILIYVLIGFGILLLIIFLGCALRFSFGMRKRRGRAEMIEDDYYKQAERQNVSYGRYGNGGGGNAASVGVTNYDDEDNDESEIDYEY